MWMLYKIFISFSAMSGKIGGVRERKETNREKKR